MAVAAVIALATACSSPSRPSFESPAVGATRATTTTTPRDLELVSAGSAPRRVLRFELRPGTRATLAVTTDVALTQVGRPRDRTIEPPPVTQTIELRVLSVRDGRSTVSFRVLDIAADLSATAVDPAAGVRLTRSLQPMVGTNGVGRLSPTGRFTAVRFDLAGALPADVRERILALPDQIDQLLPLLPGEAVGTGATWRSTDTITAAGVTLTRSSTTTVTALEGSVVRYRMDITAKADRQRIASPATDGDVKVELRSSSLTGSGTGTVDLTSLASTSAVEASGRQDVTVTPARGSAQRLEQRLELATRVRDTSS